MKGLPRTNKFSFRALLLYLSYFGICIYLVIAVVIDSKQELWKFTQIPEPLLPKFPDLRHIQGILEVPTSNPLVSNPGDPWGRPMPYPTIWIYIGKVLGLKSDHNVLILGTCLAVALMICFSIFMKLTKSFLLLLCFASSSTLLLIQRGNVDSGIFIFCSIWAVCSSQKLRDFIAILLTLLKIFPVVLLAWRGKGALLNSVLLLFLPVTLFLYPQYSLLANSNLASGKYSYGRSVFKEYFFGQIQFEHSRIFLNVLVVIVLLVIALIIKFISQGHLVEPIAKNLDSWQEMMFIAGSLIYCSTFLFTTNWDYRTIFLTLSVPYILLFPFRHRVIVGTFLLASMNSIYMDALFESWGGVINQMSKGVVFSYFIAIWFIILKQRIPKPVSLANDFIRKRKGAVE
jgi:hypothetical protein